MTDEEITSMQVGGRVFMVLGWIFVIFITLAAISHYRLEWGVQRYGASRFGMPFAILFFATSGVFLIRVGRKMIRRANRALGEE
ncbi:hypothetical protein P1X14_15270 [Sphingomonas sp. AOB5]|uniref:hypothetical protein n=1 Tax=Sphingomonas sp. AOB5 TaxID=3034017 RepID=UPI0023F8C381|nr:hypothetical protein [Sphingomonas sp. AOB5]MDF7776616.1 hypothetical protein [Sphingomonas sp. AOB5]